MQDAQNTVLTAIFQVNLG